MATRQPLPETRRFPIGQHRKKYANISFLTDLLALFVYQHSKTNNAQAVKSQFAKLKKLVYNAKLLENGTAKNSA